MDTNILDELLPREEDKATGAAKFEIQSEETISYESLRATRVNGKRAIVLPGGRIVAKALDRKQGKSTWIVVGQNR